MLAARPSMASSHCWAANDIEWLMMYIAINLTNIKALEICDDGDDDDDDEDDDDAIFLRLGHCPELGIPFKHF